MTSLHENLDNWTQRPYPKEKIFEGRFIRLEPIDPLKHLDGLCDIFLNANDVHERFRYLYKYPHKTKENIINWLEGEPKPSYHFAIVDKKKEKVVGRMRFHHIVPENGALELGIYFSDMISKTPGGTEAIYLFAKHVFDDLGYRRFQWTCDNRNEASKHCATRFGFVYEALFHQENIAKQELKDACYYSIIDEDWDLINKSCEKWLEPQNFDENGCQKEKLLDLRKRLSVELHIPINTVVPPPPVCSSEESEILAKSTVGATWTTTQPPQHVTMEGKFVILEPLNIQRHGDDLFKACMEEPQRFSYLPETPQDRQEFQTWLEKVQISKDPLYFVIIDKSTGKVAGRQTFLRIRPDEGVIEIGHIFWTSLIARKPAATEAMYLFAKHVFEDLRYRRLEWKCDRRNVPSKNAAVRFGFTYEGIFRNYRVRKSSSVDIVWLAMFSKDWSIIKLAFEKWLDLDNFDAQGQQKKKLADIREEIKLHYLKN